MKNDLTMATPKKILLISHSSHPGGAQNSMLHLINQLNKLGHSCSILFPSPHGDFIDNCLSRGIPCFHMPFKWSLPNPIEGLSGLMDDTIRLAAEQLKEHQFDLIITNTIVLLIGAELALQLDIPNIVFVLELINDDNSLKPVGVSVESYIQYLGNKTNGWLACSNAVQNMIINLGKIQPEKVLTFYPYTCAINSFKHAPQPKQDTQTSQDWKIILIGEQSNRKNPAFALSVLQLLRQKGHEVFLDHFGVSSSAHEQFMNEINIKGLSKHVYCHGWSESPLNNATAKSIHLITANCEPFGLTVPECIEAGIPVISSRCGGPEEMLPNNCLYDIGDTTNCATLIENLIINEKEHLETLHTSRMTLENVLNDGKQLKSLKTWTEKYFEKQNL